MRRILLILLALCTVLGSLCIASCKKNDLENCIAFMENGVLTARYDTAAAAGVVTLPAPAGVHAKFCAGWQATVGEQNIFLPVGASYAYEAGATVIFTPVYLHATTLSTAQLYFSAEGNGIQFITTISTAEWDKLCSAAASINRGTLIVEHDALDETTPLNHTSFEAIATTKVNAVSNDWLMQVGSENSYYGAITNIITSDLAQKYTAIGYVTVTYTDGTAATFYASYVGGAPANSLWSLSVAAVHDLADVQSEAYPYAAGGKFSPYTDEQRGYLNTYAKTLTLVIDNEIEGSISLDPIYLAQYEQRIISESSVDWYLIKNALSIKYEGALVVTRKDGTPLTQDEVVAMVLNTGKKLLTWTNFQFYNGMMLIPYSNFSDNY